VIGYTAEQVCAAEAPLLAAGEPLMLRAAEALAREIGVEVGESATILVLVGAGNNGGDALYAAGHLAQAGHDVRIVRAGDRVHEEALAAARSAGANETTDAVAAAEDSDVVVDGILGIGAHGAVRGAARELLVAVLPELLDDDGPLCVAVDVPTGVDSNDGSVADDVVFPADITVTFGVAKAGLLVQPGADYAGEVRLIDIGLGLPRWASAAADPRADRTGSET
jgi:hydroxyethylthiazole kinase-like uncharacterized protein yjeF